MATYRELHGKAVKTVTTNPSDDAAEGQIWFNSTDNTFKSSVALQAWSGSSPLSTARQSMASFGTQTSAVASTGSTSGSSPYGEQNLTEEYNGTGWTSATNNPLSMRFSAGTGTETSGLVFGGNALPGPAYVATTNEYDGSSWTSGGSLGSPVGIHAGLGTQTAALQACGYGRPPSPGSNTNTAEEYNGTSWTSTNTVNTARRTLSGSGIQTAGIIAGGYTTTRVANSEEYNGTSFSEGSDINTARSAWHLCGGTTESNSWICGGTTAPGANSTATEYYDGTSWTNQTATLGSGRSSGGAGGIQNSAVVFGGNNPSLTATTEELNQSAAAITAGAWSAGGNLNTARYQHAGAGSIPAGLVFGGRKETAPSANYNNSEEYDGTSWTEGNNLNTARFGLYGIGTQTAGLACGGRTTPAVVDSSEEYDGTSYTEGNNLASARHGGASAGTQTAGLIFNGTNVTAPAPGNMTTTSQSYDGTSWTATNSCNTARVVPYGFGTQTAAISVGGNPFSNSGESFDGTNWTAISGTLNDGRQQGFSGGTSTDGLVCGGNSPPNTTNVEAYNGTIFTTAPSLSTARRSIAGTPGTSVPAGIFGAGGYTSTELNSTEEFTPESTSLNIETLTQS
jgi:hypothetical protein